ncbi:MAG: hypothetical protein WBG38_18860, partial [Nodosilinea sp.]
PMHWAPGAVCSFLVPATPLSPIASFFVCDFMGEECMAKFQHGTFALKFLSQSVPKTPKK